jgi:hypothetical protein
MPALRGISAVCRPRATIPSQWERWFSTIHAALKRQLIVAGTPDRLDEYYRLVHAHCQRRYIADVAIGEVVSVCNAGTPQRPESEGAGI